MTKLERFCRDDHRRQVIADNIDIIREGVDALLDELIGGKINEGIPNPDVGNSYYQQSTGGKHIRDGLERLTQPVQEMRPPEGRRQFTEADRETLRERRQRNDEP